MNHNYNVLVSKYNIDVAIEKIGKQITKDFAGKNLIVFGLAEGGLMFAMDLIRHINLPLEYYTVVAKSYGDGMESGKLDIKYFPENIVWTNKEVLIVDDICDTGKTIARLKDYIREISNNNDIRIKSAVMIQNMKYMYSSEITPDYVELFSHGEWLVGYGLDDAGIFRNLDFVGYKVVKNG